MSLFDLFGKKETIDSGVKKCRETEGALLIDVREIEEYQAGHIPGSLNMPLGLVTMMAADYAQDKNTPLFVYCRSGARSGKAEEALKEAGYANVTNIGGITEYRGEIER